jgi:hypothetical protein
MSRELSNRNTPCPPHAKAPPFAVTGRDIRRRHSHVRVVVQSRSFPSC